MNDTYVTVTGNLVTKPERRRLDSGATVVNFRIGSTARRFDKRTGGWVDGNTFFVKVNCWRSLADNAYQSLFKGDPVVVTGRLYTREYEAEDGSRRVSYELEATALGHNLARGTATFSRVRSAHSIDRSDPSADDVQDQPAEAAPVEPPATQNADTAAEDMPEDGDGEYPYARMEAMTG